MAPNMFRMCVCVCVCACVSPVTAEPEQRAEEEEDVEEGERAGESSRAGRQRCGESPPFPPSPCARHQSTDERWDKSGE